MEILTLCGSPRFGRGAKECSSLYLIQQLKTRLGQGARLQTEPANPPRDLEALARALTGAQALVLAFPLYADSIPAGLLQTLSELERRLTGGSELDKIPVYSIVNCGFFEAAHNQPAIDMIEIWRKKCGFQPGRSLAVGGGEMIRQAPMGRGPLTTLSKSLDALAQNILAGKGGETLWAQPDFPRIFYQLAGNLGFRQQARKNGLRGRDISS